MRICKSCGAKIQWALTEHGKRMPVRARDDGNLAIVLRAENGDPHGNIYRLVVPFDVEQHAGTPRCVSHFVDCPNATQHRRVGK